MHRFFVEKENINDKIDIQGEDVKHIRNVLRLEIGDIIEVCDGQGYDYLVEITQISKDIVQGRVVDKKESRGEPLLEVILYQGIPKSNKMDLIIQKSVELGVSEIVPVITNRTVIKMNDKAKEHKKVERWQRIALEASKQSKRGIIPRVRDVISFDQMLEMINKEDFTIVPYECERKIGLKEILKKYNSGRINIIIGPEGGFEETEINRIRSINSHVVTLGPRVLRTETAGFTTIVAVMYELGDVGVV